MDTNKEREGQGGVYDMEGQKMEGSARKGLEEIGLRSKKSPVSRPSSWCFTERATPPSMLEESGCVEKMYWCSERKVLFCCGYSLSNSIALLHSPT